MTNRTINANANVWSLAAIIYEMITDQEVPQELFTITCKGGVFVDTYRTFGLPLLALPEGTYSTALKALLFGCLSYYPNERPTLGRILREIEESLDVFQEPDNQGVDDPNLFVKLTPPNDPTTPLDPTEVNRWPLYDSVVSQVRSKFKDLNFGLGSPSGSGGGGDAEGAGVAVGTEEDSPGQPRWRVQAYSPLPASPLSLAQQQIQYDLDHPDEAIPSEV